MAIEVGVWVSWNDCDEDALAIGAVPNLLRKTVEHV